MDATFSVAADPALSLVRITVGGFFQPDDIRRFGEQRDREHARLRCAPNQHLTLVDMRAMRIQSQEGVDGFGQLLANPAHRSRRIAFVVEATLARMQIKRAAAGRDDAMYFRDPAEAEAWLLGTA